MKKLILPIIVLLLIIQIASGLDDCNKIMLPEDVPCNTISTWNYTKPCTNHLAVVYDLNGNNTENFTFQAWGGSNLCFFIWNISTIGSYNYQVTNGDSGNVLIKTSELKMISIMMGLIAVALFFYALAFFNVSPALKIFGYGNVLVQVFNIVFLLYANEMGADLTVTLRTNFLITLIGISALVLISIFFITLKLLMPTQDNPELDPLKWNGVKWDGRR